MIQSNANYGAEGQRWQNSRHNKQNCTTIKDTLCVNLVIYFVTYIGHYINTLYITYIRHYISALFNLSFMFIHCHKR